MGIMIEEFQQRMEAQCDEIRKYWLLVKHEQGRNITMEQAAKEWIANFAGEFARKNDHT